MYSREVAVGKMTNVPFFYVKPPEVSVASVPHGGSRGSVPSAGCAGVVAWMQSCRYKEEVVVSRGAGRRGRKRKTERVAGTR